MKKFLIIILFVIISLLLMGFTNLEPDNICPLKDFVVLGKKHIEQINTPDEWLITVEENGKICEDISINKNFWYSLNIGDHKIETGGAKECNSGLTCFLDKQELSTNKQEGTLGFVLLILVTLGWVYFGLFKIDTGDF